MAKTPRQLQREIDQALARYRAAGRYDEDLYNAWQAAAQAKWDAQRAAKSDARQRRLRKAGKI